jgi:hypothetical protein
MYSQKHCSETTDPNYFLSQQKLIFDNNNSKENSVTAMSSLPIQRSRKDIIVLLQCFVLLLVHPRWLHVDGQNNGTFKRRFMIVRASLSSSSTLQVLGRYPSGATVNISQFSGPISLVAGIDCCFSKVNFTFQGITTTDTKSPFALRGNVNGTYTPIPNLLIPGTKQIRLDGINSSSMIFRTFDLTFTIVGTIKTRSVVVVPTPATVPVPVFVPTPVAVPTPVYVPEPVPPTIQNGTWYETNANAPIQARHEACFIMVGRRAVLLGGRGTKRPQIYNPVTKLWSDGNYPPGNIQLHHMQCVVVQNKVWIVSAWTGDYPNEQNAPNIYVYDPIADQWETRSPMPLSRRRGSSAVIAVGTDIYVAFGNNGGHETGNFATSYAWLDKYNTITGAWTILANGNVPRDHTGGALINNNKFCVAAGRDGGTIGWPTVEPTECYNIATNTWSTESNIAQPRGGSAYASYTCGNDNSRKGLLVAGGEGFGAAWKNFDLFNGTHWITLPSMNRARHGTGLAVDCVCGAIYIASGANTAGGGAEFNSLETFYLNGKVTPCLA